MKGSRFTAVALALCLGAGTPVASALQAPPPTIPPTADVVDVEGQGFLKFLGCVGCMAGGFALIASGPVGIILAAAAPGSAIALATCAYLCATM